MSSAAKRTRLTAREYLVLERRAETKSEFFDGEMFAMSGASRKHNLIAGNIFAELNARFRARPCEAYTGDMRVLVERSGLYTYPDVVAVCGEPEFLDAEVDTLLNPTVIVEVESRSTRGYDRGRKFGHYRRLESLKEYVLVARDSIWITYHQRRAEDWSLTDLRGRRSLLPLDSIACSIPLDVIYDKTGLLDMASDEER